MRSSRVTASVVAAFTAGLLSTSALAQHHMTPLPGQHGFVGTRGQAPYVAPPKIKSGTWSGLAHAYPGDFPDTAVQLTDGTMLMHNGCTQDWYKLTPDNTGSYQNGTWTKMAQMPAGYTPLYFASQVLPSGQLIVNGGEYLNCSAVWTNKGALYDPVANSWTNVTPPSGWSKIGDAQAVVRSDGQYMLADCCNTLQAIATVSGTTVTWTPTGTGKGDSNNEEGWTLLPDQTILTVDCNRNLSSGFNNTEIYSEATGTWTTVENTPNTVVDAGSHELGPAPLLPNGLVFQIGATAHTAVYNYLTGHWTAGPDMPVIDGQLDSADGPAAVLPNGHILMQVSPGVFNAPSHFVEVEVVDETHVTMKQVNEPASAAQQSSYEGRLIPLPTGQVLWSSDVGDVQIYTPQGKPNKKAIPTVKKVPATLTRGSVDNIVKGKGFNGVSYGAYYGDDVQTSTNYPLVRFTNNSTGHVCYAKTHGYATGISDGSITTAKYDIPAGCEAGPSTLEVVVNGVASKAKATTLN